MDYMSVCRVCHQTPLTIQRLDLFPIRGGRGNYQSGDPGGTWVANGARGVHNGPEGPAQSPGLAISRFIIPLPLRPDVNSSPGGLQLQSIIRASYYGMVAQTLRMQDTQRMAGTAVGSRVSDRFHGRSVNLSPLIGSVAPQS